MGENKIIKELILRRADYPILDYPGRPKGATN